MTTLSTHDTKRSDDIRARLAVLSEIPDDFGDAVWRWNEMNAAYITAGGLPDRGTEWFLYQTMVGAWPITKERLIEYMTKAMREAKLRTSWVSNNEEYENAFKSFIEQIYDDENFIADLEVFVGKVLLAGRTNSLTQTLLKCISPGVPDLYQGGELWDLSLVDPDNRRPVDYVLRRRLLAEARDLTAAEISQRMDEGMPKLWLLHKVLRLRKANRKAFGPTSDYLPLAATGSKAHHVIGVQRGDDVIGIAPVHTMHLRSNWSDTVVHLPEGNWKNEMTGKNITGGAVRIAALLEEFPVALLTHQSQNSAQV